MLFSLKNSKDKILIIGPLYDNFKCWDRAETLFQFYDKIIINGSALFPENISTEKRFNRLKDYVESGKVIYNLSANDWNLMKDIKYYDFLSKCPNVIIINCVSQVKFIVVSGGLNTNNIKDLEDNIEVSFINNEDSHNSYKGGIGYLITNNPLTELNPKCYSYSTQIGNKLGYSVYAQELNQYGLGRTILL